MNKTRMSVLALGVVLLGMVCFAYWDHFHNPFQFDDHHTIQSNSYIRDMSKYMGKYFTDATTFSSLPQNQSYRPIVTLLNAFDYKMSGVKGEPDPFQFHITIFISFLLLGILLYFFSLKIFNLTGPHALNPYLALLVTAIYTLHAANAETINYIISRSDSFSTLLMVGALCLFAYQKGTARYFTYLVLLVLAFLTKEPAVMIGPLAFLFLMLIEENYSLADTFTKTGKLFGLLVKILPAFAVSLIVFIIYKKMTPSTWTSGSSNYVQYWLTQPFVIVHYVCNYFIPLNLTADTDWNLVQNWYDERTIIGTVFIIATLWLAYKASLKRETRPVTYGIIWFYLCLLPTSIIPFSEVLNDHRPFLPYIGLTIALVSGLFHFYVKYENGFFKSSFIKGLSVIAIVGILVTHMFGVRTRCEVWSSGESLWKDVTIKSPHNGRGLMNYGNALMSNGDYKGALEYFNKAKQEWPYYSYIYTNLGVLYNAMGNPTEADANFKYARQLNSQNPEFYYFYSVFLRDQKRFQEAVNMVNTGLALSPQHPGLNFLKTTLIANPQYAASEKDRIATIEKTTKDNPTKENWLNLSLIYYNAGRFQDCATAAEEALKLDPNYDLAYNNICSAYNMLKEWDKAIAAGQRAVQLNPKSVLAKNNLAAALKGKASGQ